MALKREEVVYLTQVAGELLNGTPLKEVQEKYGTLGVQIARMAIGVLVIEFDLPNPLK